MTTNANNDESSSSESASDARIRAAQDEDWEGLRRPHKQAAKSADSVDDVFTGLGIFFFIVCWIVLGVFIFHVLTGMGVVVVLAVLGGIIGGFIADVILWMMGMAGISL